MATVDDIAQFLENFAPPELAADWDNVGLLVGERQRSVHRVMTCLTITPASAEEAVNEQADLVVAHHPLPFRPLKRLTTDTHEGRLLWTLMSSGISVYSPHTAFDSALQGINQRLAEGIGLHDIRPLVQQAESTAHVGTGRIGSVDAAANLSELAKVTKQFLKVDGVQIVGQASMPIQKVAIGCGSAGEFLNHAWQAGCQCLVTGETRFHTCLEAEALGMALILTGHFASERFAVEWLAAVLAERFADVSVWASRQERDPLRWI